MKHNLTTLVFAFLVTGVFAQNEMLSLPNGSSGIATTTSGYGVAIGPGFTDPEGRLHVYTESNNGTALFLETKSGEQAVIGEEGDPTTIFTNPDFFIRARRVSHQLPGPGSVEFSVDVNGKIQSGFYSAGITDQLAVRNNLGIYASVDRKLRFDLTNGSAKMFWESPGDNFEFVNADNSTVALQLGEMGEVGVNTGIFSDQHKLHVEGGALADYNVVQPAVDWDTGDNYLGMYFTDNPELRWNSDATSYFEFKAADTGEVPLRLSSEGKVGINTDCFTGTHSLYIEGSAIAEEIFVQLKSAWCDYVFADDYYLRPLAEVEDYIKENGHLPNIPSAAEIEETGIPVGEMERLLTEKVEELTLYVIELKKEIDTLKEEIKD